MTKINDFREPRRAPICSAMTSLAPGALTIALALAACSSQPIDRLDATADQIAVMGDNDLCDAWGRLQYNPYGGPPATVATELQRRNLSCHAKPPERLLRVQP
jgi:hypothetical protein